MSSAFLHVKPSRDIAALRDRLEPRARARWGDGWIRGLAAAADIPLKTLHTLFSRGQKMPPGDRLQALERAVGLLPAASDPAPSRPVHLLAEFQERHTFSALVEALKKLEAGADPARYRAAWTVVDGTSIAVRALAGWTDADWAALVGKDHWKRLTRHAEADTIREAREA